MNVTRFIPHPDNPRPIDPATGDIIAEIRLFEDGQMARVSEWKPYNVEVEQL